MVGPWPYRAFTFRALSKTYGQMWLRCDVCRRYAWPKLAGRLSRSGSAAAASINSSGTSIDIPDPRQFDKCATKPIDGKPCRRLPGMLLRIGMLASGNPSLGRTLVAACHRT
jgi:hypothetical protein